MLLKFLLRKTKYKNNIQYMYKFNSKFLFPEITINNVTYFQYCNYIRKQAGC